MYYNFWDYEIKWIDGSTAISESVGAEQPRPVFSAPHTRESSLLPINESSQSSSHGQDTRSNQGLNGEARGRTQVRCT
uniref:Uncharacterized protein n=1 Tax=Oryza nivara TaxID=4536 RepID=A0A0E0IXE9_ORYNI